MRSLLGFCPAVIIESAQGGLALCGCQGNRLPVGHVTAIRVDQSSAELGDSEAEAVENLALRLIADCPTDGPLPVSPDPVMAPAPGVEIPEARLQFGEMLADKRVEPFLVARRQQGGGLMFEPGGRLLPGRRVREVVKCSMVVIDDACPVDGKIVQPLLLVASAGPARNELLGPEGEQGGARWGMRRAFLALRVAPDVDLPILGCLGGVVGKAGEKGQAIVERSLGVAAPLGHGLEVVDQKQVGLARLGGACDAVAQRDYHRQIVPSPGTWRKVQKASVTGLAGSKPIACPDTS